MDIVRLLYRDVQRKSVLNLDKTKKGKVRALITYIHSINENKRQFL